MRVEKEEKGGHVRRRSMGTGWNGLEYLIYNAILRDTFKFSN